MTILSVTAKESHTPAMSNKNASKNINGIIIISPLSMDIIKDFKGLSTELKYTVVIILLSLKYEMLIFAFLKTK